MSQPTSPSTRQTPSRTAGTPAWWNDQHTSSWERVKEALQRDWEQTKADFTNDRGHDLHQHAGDTIKQAVGAAPVPPVNVQTHPDLVTDAEKEADRVRQKAASATMAASERITKANEAIAAERIKLNEKILAAEKELEREQAKATDKIADAEDDAVEGIKAAERERAVARSEIYTDPKAARDDLEKANGKIAGEKAKLQEKVLDARQELANEARRAHEKILDARDGAVEHILKEQTKVDEAIGRRDEAVAEWKRVEPGLRYGYGARAQYPTEAWSETLEVKLSREWDALNTGRSWDDSKRSIRTGWDYAAQKR